MSRVVSAPLAKLFGFSPRYVWDDFAEEHQLVAKEIRFETRPLLDQIEEIESSITDYSKRILRKAKVNVKQFTALCVQRRKLQLHASKLQAAEDPAPTAPTHCESCVSKDRLIDMLTEDIEQLEKTNEAWQRKCRRLKRRLSSVTSCPIE